MAQDITRICTTLPNSGKPSIPCEPCPLIPYTLFPIPYSFYYESLEQHRNN